MAKEHSHLKLSAGMPREQIRELKQAGWERHLGEALVACGKTSAQLETRPRVVDWKLNLARELRGGGASVAWIADRLCLGKPSSLRSHLCRAGRSRNQQTAA